jgi:hypothetical protein
MAPWSMHKDATATDLEARFLPLANLTTSRPRRAGASLARAGRAEAQGLLGLVDHLRMLICFLRQRARCWQATLEVSHR